MATPELNQSELDKLQQLWRQNTPEADALQQSRVFVINPSRDSCCRLRQTPYHSIDTRARFGNNEPKGFIPQLKDEEIPTAHFVASLGTIEDLFMFAATVDQLRERYKIGSATAVISHLPCTREDRKLEFEDEGMTNVITLDRVISELSVVDKAAIVQPHSPNTPRSGLKHNLPVLSVSPWPVIVDYMVNDNHSFDLDNTVVAGPDQGSRLMEARVSEYLGVDLVTFDARRDKRTGKKTFKPLTAEQQDIVRDKLIITIDDVGSSFSTIGGIARLLSYARARGLLVGCIHADLTRGWRRHLRSQEIKRIFYGDTRVPIGDPQQESRLVRVPMVGFVERIVRGDMAGVDPFTDPEYQDLLLFPQDLLPSRTRITNSSLVA